MNDGIAVRPKYLRALALGGLALALAAGCAGNGSDASSTTEETGAAVQAATAPAQAMILIDTRLYQFLQPLIDQYRTLAQARRGFPIQLNVVDHLDDYPYSAVRTYVQQQRTANPAIQGVVFVGNIKLPSFYKPRNDIPQTEIFPAYFEDLDATFPKTYADGAVDPVCTPTNGPNCVVSGSPLTVPQHDLDTIVLGANPGPEIWAAFMPVGVTGGTNLYNEFASQLTPYLTKVISFYQGQLPTNGRYYFVSNDIGEDFGTTWASFGPAAIDFYGKPGPAGQTGAQCILSSGQNVCYARWPTETYANYAAFDAAYVASPWVGEGWQTDTIYMQHMNAARYDVAEVNVHSNELWSLVSTAEAKTITKAGLVVTLDGCNVAALAQPISPSHVDSTTLPSDNVALAYLYGSSSALAAFGDPFERGHYGEFPTMYQDMKVNHDYLGAAHLNRMKKLYADVGGDANALKENLGEMFFGDPFMDLTPVTSTGLSANVAVTSSWTANGQLSYCANLTIANAGPNTVSSWAIALNTHQSTIYNSWTANFAGTAPNYQVTPLSYNSTIPAKNSLTFGFCANATGASWTPTVSSVSGY